MTAYSVAILAGGLSTSLRPITEKIPKALLEVAGRPFIHHQLKLLKDRGISRVVICAGYLGGRIRDSVSDGRLFGLEISYSFDGDKLLGTGGALQKALPLLGPAFFVIYGDSYLTCDFPAVQKAFETSSRLGLLTAYRHESQPAGGNISFKDGLITVYDESKPSNNLEYVDYGLSLLKAEAFQKAPAEKPFDLATLYQRLLITGDLAAYEVFTPFYNISSKEGRTTLDDLLQIRQISPPEPKGG